MYHVPMDYINKLQFSIAKRIDIGLGANGEPTVVRETWIQSQVTSYQRLLKWYLMPLCLTLGTIRYVSRCP